MKFEILTLFPNQMNALVNESILKRAQTDGKLQIKVHDLRAWTTDERKTVDDKPFGGGPGMLMMVEPIYKALVDLGVYPTRDPATKVILTAAAGQTWNQSLVKSYSATVNRLIIICGHYEGVDHRVSEKLIDAEISIGNYVLTGGELAAGVIVDSISRLVPGVLGNQDSLLEESHNDITLDSGSDVAKTIREYPQYTRPAAFVTNERETWNVPDILLSGNHAAIKSWREAQKR